MEGLGALPKVPSFESKFDPRKAFFWPNTLLECSYYEPPSNQDQVVCELPCFIRQTEWGYPHNGHARRM